MIGDHHIVSDVGQAHNAVSVEKHVITHPRIRVGNDRSQTDAQVPSTPFQSPLVKHPAHKDSQVKRNEAQGLSEELIPDPGAPGVANSELRCPYQRTDQRYEQPIDQLSYNVHSIITRDLLPPLALVGRDGPILVQRNLAIIVYFVLIPDVW